MRSRPSGVLEGFFVALLVVGRLAIGLAVLHALVQAGGNVLQVAPAEFAFRWGGWIAAAQDENTLLWAGALSTVLALVRRLRAPSRLELVAGQWTLLKRRRVADRWQASEVVSVSTVPQWVVCLLALVPGCPRAWRPVGGALRGWRAIRTAQGGMRLLPLRQPVAAAHAFAVHRGSVPVPPSRRLLRTAMTGALQVLWLLPVGAGAAVATILTAPASQGWISPGAAAVAFWVMDREGLDSLATTRLLRLVAEAGNPAVLRMIAARLGPAAHRLDLRALSDLSCPKPLAKLAESGRPVSPVTATQRQAMSDELAAVIQALESKAEAVLPRAQGSSLAALAVAARIYSLCPDAPPPYWRGTWSAEAVWPKGADGALLRPRTLDPREGELVLDLTSAVESGALELTDRFGPFDMTPIMLVLDELRMVRLGPKDPAAKRAWPYKYEESLDSAAEYLAMFKGAEHHGAQDRFGRSVAYMAAAAGHTLAMRLAVAMGEPSPPAPTVAGASVLHAAAAAGHLPSAEGDIEWLMSKGFDPQARDRQGRTPVEWASNAAVAQRLRTPKVLGRPAAPDR